MVQSFIKIERELRPLEGGQTDRQTDQVKTYPPSSAEVNNMLPHYFAKLECLTAQLIIHSSHNNVHIRH